MNNSKENVNDVLDSLIEEFDDDKNVVVSEDNLETNPETIKAIDKTDGAGKDAIAVVNEPDPELEDEKKEEKTTEDLVDEINDLVDEKEVALKDNNEEVKDEVKDEVVVDTVVDTKDDEPNDDVNEITDDEIDEIVTEGLNFYLSLDENELESAINTIEDNCPELNDIILEYLDSNNLNEALKDAANNTKDSVSKDIVKDEVLKDYDKNINRQKAINDKAKEAAEKLHANNKFMQFFSKAYQKRALSKKMEKADLEAKTKADRAKNIENWKNILNVFKDNGEDNDKLEKIKNVLNNKDLMDTDNTYDDLMKKLNKIKEKHIKTSFKEEFLKLSNLINTLNEEFSNENTSNTSDEIKVNEGEKDILEGVKRVYKIDNNPGASHVRVEKEYYEDNIDPENPKRRVKEKKIAVDEIDGSEEVISNMDKPNTGKKGVKNGTEYGDYKCLVKENYSDFELMKWLDENGFEPCFENVQVLNNYFKNDNEEQDLKLKMKEDKTADNDIAKKENEDKDIKDVEKIEKNADVYPETDHKESNDIKDIEVKNSDLYPEDSHKEYKDIVCAVVESCKRLKEKKLPLNIENITEEFKAVIDMYPETDHKESKDITNVETKFEDVYPDNEHKEEKDIVKTEMTNDDVYPECEHIQLSESYNSLKEAMLLDEGYFFTDTYVLETSKEKQNRLQEQIALHLAKDNNDKLYEEVLNTAEYLTNLQEAIFKKYQKDSFAKLDEAINLTNRK